MNPKSDCLPTFSDLRHLVGIGRAKHVSGEGRNKVYQYRHGVMCALGDIEQSEWQKMMRELIHRSGEDELYQHLYQWHREHNFLQQSKAEFDQDVLKLHSARIFDDLKWVDFIPFNQKYRPEALRGINVVTACTECCGTPFLTTQARIEHDGKSTTHCGICGRWSPYQILSTTTL